MPVLDGAYSGIDSNKIIKKLKEVEKRPIQRLRREQNEIQLEIVALQELHKTGKELEASLKQLHNFESEFGTKKIISNPNGYIEGIVNKGAKPAKYQIEVKNLATNLIIRSHQLNNETSVPAGSISINNINKKFSGGNLDEFYHFLKNEYKDVLIPKKIKIDNQISAIILESKEQGKKAIFNIKDPSQILEKLGFYKANSASSLTDKQSTNNSGEEEIAFNFEVNNMINKGGDAQVILKQLTLKNKAARQFLLNIQPPKKDHMLKAVRLEVVSTEKEQPPQDVAPASLRHGKQETINIKGLKLYSYNILRQRKKKQVPTVQSDYGVKIVYNPITAKNQQDNKQEEYISLKNQKNTVDIPLQTNISSLEFTTQHANTTFSNPRLVYAVPKSSNLNDKNKQLAEKQKKMFPNLLKPAQNSIVSVDGIDLERDKNEGLDDIIDGAKLKLIQPTESPIQTEVQIDIEKPIGQINKFVNTYNQLLDVIYQTSSANTTLNEPGKLNRDSKIKGEVGILVGNSAIRTLLSEMRLHISKSYPSLRDPSYKILPMIGISTGEIGAKWESIKKGYLQVNETKLIEAITEYPEAVKDLFGVDTDYDRKTDNGFAYKLEKFLKPYFWGYNPGIIYVQIETKKSKIKTLEENIKKVETKADAYENKLKRKFGAMESAVQKQKAIGNQLRQRLGIKDK